MARKSVGRRGSGKVNVAASSGNVFRDVGFPRVEAERLRIRSDLMRAVHNTIKNRGLTQAAAARLLGVTQPRVSDLVRGRIDLFSIDTLIDMLTRAGLEVEVRARKGA